MDDSESVHDSVSSRVDPGDAAYKTETLRRGNEDMRRRISELRDTLQLERARLRDAHVEKVVSVKRQRDISEQEKLMLLEEQKTKLLEEKRSELRAYQQQLQQQQEDKMREIMRKRDESEKRRKELDGYERAQREHSVRQLTQEEARQEMEGTYGAELQSLRDQLLEANQHKLHLEKLLALKTKSDMEKSDQIKQLLEESTRGLSSISKENQQSSRQETLERKRKDAEIKKLEEEMSVLRRNNDRLEAEKSKFSEELIRRRAADSLARRTPQKIKPGIGLYDPGLTGSASASPSASAPLPASPRRDDADRGRLLEAQREARELKTRIALLETENETLRTMPKRDAEQSNERVAELTKRSSELAATGRRNQSRIKELETQCKDSEEQCRQLQEDLRKARVELTRRVERPSPAKPPVAAPAAGPSKELVALQAQLAQQEASSKALKEQLADRDKRFEALKREQRETTQSLATMKAGAASSASQDASLAANHRLLQKEHVQLQQQIARLRAASAGPSKDVAVLKREIADLRSKCSSLNEEADASKAALEAAQAEMRDSRAGKLQLQSVQADCAQLRGKLDAALAEKQRLVAELKKVNEQLNGMEAFEQQVTDLEVEKEELRDQLTVAEAKIAGLERAALSAGPRPSAPAPAAAASVPSPSPLPAAGSRPSAGASAAPSVPAVSSVPSLSAAGSRPSGAAAAASPIMAAAGPRTSFPSARAAVQESEELSGSEAGSEVEEDDEEISSPPKKDDSLQQLETQKKVLEAQRSKVEAEAQRIKAETEAQKKKAEEEALKKRAETEAQRKKAEEEALKKKAEEEAALKKKEAEAQQKKAEEEALKKKAEAEAQRIKMEAEAAKKKAEEEAQRKKAEEEALKKKEAEAQQKKAEVEAQKQKAEAEAQRIKEAEAAKKMAEEEAQRKKAAAEAEAQQKKAEEEAQKKKAELEAEKKKAEAKALEETRRKPEARSLADELNDEHASPVESDEEARAGARDMDDYSDDFEPSPARGALERIPEDSAEEERGSNLRFFQAVYEFNEQNEEDDEQLTFDEGDCFAVFGDCDEDGFYHCKNKFGDPGVIPSNFVTEIDVMTARANCPELVELVQDLLPLPQPPTNVEVERSADTYLLLAWTAPPDISLLEGYRIVVDGKVEAEIQGADATLGRVPLALQPGASHRIAVVSFTRSTQSVPSEPVVYQHRPKQAAAGATASLASAAPSSSALSAISAPKPAPAPAPAAAPAPAPAPAAVSSPALTAPAVLLATNGASVNHAAAHPTVAHHADEDDEHFDDDDTDAVASPKNGHGAEDVANGAEDVNYGDDIWSQRKRRFLALCDYDPENDSPNDDPSEELPLENGQIITVYGEIGPDLFFHGEYKGRRGVVASTLVQEVPNMDLEENGVDDGDYDEEDVELPEGPPFPVGSIVKVLYDYEPAEMSPNDDGLNDELPFREGDFLKIISNRDIDGFYQAEHKATLVRGLVPHNFIALHAAPSSGGTPVPAKEPAKKKGLLSSIKSKMGLSKK